MESEGWRFHWFRLDLTERFVTRQMPGVLNAVHQLRDGQPKSLCQRADGIQADLFPAHFKIGDVVLIDPGLNSKVQLAPPALLP